MKQLLTILLFLVISILCKREVFAQPSNVGRSFIQLKVDGKVAEIDNLNIKDSIGTDNKMVHLVSFDMALNGLDDTKAIFHNLQTVSKLKKNLQLIFTTFNSSRVPLEEKTYSNAIVQEIMVPAFDLSSKSVIKATVKLKAESVQIQTKITKAPLDKTVTINNPPSYLSNFKLSLGDLPTNRVLKISSISIFPGDSQLQNISLEVSGADAVKWNQKFLANSGGVQKEQGTIEILSPNMISVLYTILLSDVELISFHTNSNQQGGNAIIGLRLKNIMLK